MNGSRHTHIENYVTMESRHCFHSWPLFESSQVAEDSANAQGASFTLFLLNDVGAGKTLISPGLLRIDQCHPTGSFQVYSANPTVVTK